MMVTLKPGQRLVTEKEVTEYNADKLIKSLVERAHIEPREDPYAATQAAIVALREDAERKRLEADRDLHFTPSRLPPLHPLAQQIFDAKLRVVLAYGGADTLVLHAVGE